MMLKISLDSRRKFLKIGLTSIMGLSLLMTGCGEDGLDSELLGNFTLDVPIAYVKRPIETLANPRNATNYQPGGNLWIREYASASAPEKNVTAQYTRGCDDPNQAIEGDVSDPDVSYDGKKIVFAMIPGNYHPDDPNECNDEEYTWSLFEYILETEEIIPVVNPIYGIQVTATNPKNIGREEGNDIDPVYLPDGRVVFSSDRQATRGPLTLQDYGIAVDKDLPLFDEGGNNEGEATMNLHVMPVGGNKNNITQITFNQSHDLNPSVLQNGKIIYSRWEQAYNINNQFDIYQVNPDGTEQELLYGAHSHDTATGSEQVFLHPRQISGSPARIITTLMPRQNTFEGGELVYIDYENFAEINVPKITNSSSNANGQYSATGGRVPVTEGNLANGRYTTPFPLWDNTNRALVAWAPCKVLLQDMSTQFCTLANDMTLEPAPAEYGIWIFDLDAKTQRQMVFPEPGFTITDPIAIIDREEAQNAPVVILDKTAPADLDQDLLDADKGKLVIKSVYDTDNFALLNMGTQLGSEVPIPCTTNNASTPNSACAETGSPDINAIKQLLPVQRPARFLRVIKPAPIVDVDNENAEDMREILGYIPIEPDGSVVVEVPANRPLALEILGVNGNLVQKFQIHNSWIQVMPGETKVCNGCHSSRDGQPALNQGAADLEPMNGFLGTVLTSQQDATPGDPNDPPVVPRPLLGEFGVAEDLIPITGETMAETRARISCARTTNKCSSQKLNPDIEFHDVWRDPNSWRSPTTPTVPPTPSVLPVDLTLHFAYKFQFLNIDSNFTVLAPANVPVQPVGTDPVDFNTFSSCTPIWDASCRIVYNYETHIQKIWEKERQLVDPNNNNAPVMNSVTMTQVNYKCTHCHAPKNFANNLPDEDRVPAGQLDLTKDGPPVDMNEYTSFRELINGDNAQELVGGVLIEEATRMQFDGTVDANNVPQQSAQPVPLPIPPRLIPGANTPPSGEEMVIGDPLLEYTYVNDNYIRPNNNSRSDGSFLNKMTTAPDPVDACDPIDPCYPGTANHNEMLNDVEIRLINEWIDTGGRYFSDLVDAPPN